MGLTADEAERLLIRRLYRQAGEISRKTGEAFGKVLAEKLSNYGLPVPAKYAGSAPKVATAAASVAAPAAGTATRTAIPRGPLPVVLAGAAIAGVAALGVYLWRRHRRRTSTR